MPQPLNSLARLETNDVFEHQVCRRVGELWEKADEVQERSRARVFVIKALAQPSVRLAWRRQQPQPRSVRIQLRCCEGTDILGRRLTVTTVPAKVVIVHLIRDVMDLEWLYCQRSRRPSLRRRCQLRRDSCFTGRHFCNFIAACLVWAHVICCSPSPRCSLSGAQTKVKPADSREELECVDRRRLGAAGARRSPCCSQAARCSVSHSVTLSACLPACLPPCLPPCLPASLPA
jgi:hypothetical protein